MAPLHGGRATRGRVPPGMTNTQLTTETASPTTGFLTTQSWFTFSFDFTPG